MIIRKPFKFLIQHFRLIHVFILLGIGFVTYKSYALMNFFDGYVKANYTTTATDLQATYIGFLYTFILFLLIVACGIIIYLFQKKDKNNKFYIILLAFYVASYVFILISKSYLDVYEFSSVESSIALLFRDISRFAFYPNFLWIILVFLKAIGFDITKFSFINYQEEIEIADADDEEVELGTPIEEYEVKRTLHKTMRELRYYFVENKMFFYVISAFAGIYLLFTIVGLVQDLAKNVSLKQNFTHGDFKISIQDSLLTTVDYTGKTIQDGYSYLVMIVHVENQTEDPSILSTDTFWLDLGNQYYFPVLERSSRFLDLGEPYYGAYILAGSSHDYVLAYEIPTNCVENKFTVKVLDKITYSKGVATPVYKELKLTPRTLSSSHTTYGFGDAIDFSNTNLGNSSYTLNDASFTNTYLYNYQFCYKEEDCMDSTGMQTPSDYKKTLLVLDGSLTLDEDSNYAKYQKTSSFYNDFFQLECTYSGKTYVSSLTYVNISKDTSNKKVFEVDSYCSKSTSATLIISVRQNQYSYTITN